MSIISPWNIKGVCQYSSFCFDAKGTPRLKSSGVFRKRTVNNRWRRSGVFFRPTSEPSSTIGNFLFPERSLFPHQKNVKNQQARAPLRPTCFRGRIYRWFLQGWLICRLIEWKLLVNLKWIGVFGIRIRTIVIYWTYSESGISTTLNCSRKLDHSRLLCSISSSSPTATSINVSIPFNHLNA